MFLLAPQQAVYKYQHLLLTSFRGFLLFKFKKLFSYIFKEKVVQSSVMHLPVSRSHRLDVILGQVLSRVHLV